MADITKIKVNGAEYDIKDDTAVHVVDDSMSTTSLSPVQNRVVTDYINSRTEQDILMCSGYNIYDANNPNIVVLRTAIPFNKGNYWIPLINISGLKYSAKTNYRIIDVDICCYPYNQESYKVFSVQNKGSAIIDVVKVFSYVRSGDETLYTAFAITSSDSVFQYASLFASYKDARSVYFVTDQEFAKNKELWSFVTPTTLPVPPVGADNCVEFKVNNYNSESFYGTCITAAGTSTKNVDCPNFLSHNLKAGAIIDVRFSYENSAAVNTLKLNVNGTGEFPIRMIDDDGRGSELPLAGMMRSNVPYRFTFTGLSWILHNMCRQSLALLKNEDPNLIVVTDSEGHVETTEKLDETEIGFIPDRSHVITNGSTSFDVVQEHLLRGSIFAGISAHAIAIEYSQDSGATWVDYGASYVVKKGLFMLGFTNPNFTYVYCGGPSVTAGDPAYQVRITVNCRNNNVYGNLNKVRIRVNTGGSTGCTVTIQGDEISSIGTFKDLVTDRAIDGWSGSNTIITPSVRLGGTASTYYNSIRFIFKYTGLKSTTGTVYKGLSVYGINAYGTERWTTPSILSRHDQNYYIVPINEADGDKYHVIYEGIQLLNVPVINCATGANVTNKVAGFTGMQNAKGTMFFIRFTKGNTASDPKLQLSTATGFLPIYVNNALPGSKFQIEANTIVQFVYNEASNAYEAIGIKSENIKEAVDVFPGGVCDTAANVGAKTATVPGFSAENLTAGSIVFITFKNTNGAPTNSLSLDVNGTGAKPIKMMRNGSLINIVTVGLLSADTTLRFIYDGGNWVCDCYYDYNATNELTVNYSPLVSQSGPLYGYKLCLSDKEGLLVPINTVNGGNTNFSKALTSSAFNPFGQIYFYNSGSTTEVGQRISSSVLKAAFLAIMTHSFNIHTSGTEGTTSFEIGYPVYLKALYDDSTGTATLVQDLTSNNYLERSSVVQHLPSVNPNTGLFAGQRYIYIYLGFAYSKYQINIEVNHQVYTWDGRPFTSAPQERSGTFYVTDGVGSVDTWTYYKNGKNVTVSGKYTGSSTSLTLGPLLFKPNQDMSMIYPLMSGSTLCLCILKVTANSTSIITAGYQSGATTHTLTWLPIAGASGSTITFSYTTDE